MAAVADAVVGQCTSHLEHHTSEVDCLEVLVHIMPLCCLQEN